MIAILGWTVFGLAIVVGLLLDLVGLFGNWIILAAVALAWAATGFEHFGGWAVIALAALAAAGEVFEMAAAGYGASRFGASKGAVIAALVGCLAGAVFGTPWFPVIGTLVRACAGAFLGAASYEYLMARKQPDMAIRAGAGAALGKVAGTVAKALVGFVMLIIAALSY